MGGRCASGFGGGIRNQKENPDSSLPRMDRMLRYDTVHEACGSAAPGSASLLVFAVVEVVSPEAAKYFIRLRTFYVTCEEIVTQLGHGFNRSDREASGW